MEKKAKSRETQAQHLMATQVLSLILLCLGPLSSSSAAEAGGTRATIYGAGNASCGVWIEQRKLGRDGSSDLMLSWAQGYISALGGHDVLRMASTDEAAMSAFFDKFCQENPLQKFGLAVAALSLALAEMK